MAEAPVADDPLRGWDPRRRAALENLWARFGSAEDGRPDLVDELVAGRRREAAADDELTLE